MSDENLTVVCPVCDTVINYNRSQAGTDIHCQVCFEHIKLPTLLDIDLEKRSPSVSVNSIDYTKERQVPPEIYPGSSTEKSYFSNIFDVLMQKGHRLLAVYAVVNACLATYILGLFLHFFIGNGIACLLLGFFIYATWLYFALSPMGENYLRHNTGCKAITRVEDNEFITPIFYRVLAKAQVVDPSIPRDVTIFINDSKAPNAFALGRKSVCVTRGLLQHRNMPIEFIEAVLAHEFGHLSHKDTDIILLLNVGNVIQNLFFKFLDIVAMVITWIFAIIGALLGIGLGVASRRGDGDAFGGLGYGIGKLLRWAINKLIWLWLYLAHLCMMRASRNDEFKADEFAFNLGYGNELCAFLDWLGKLSKADEDKGPQRFFALLERSHPATGDRIVHLQDLGATYRNDTLYHQQ